MMKSLPRAVLVSLALTLSLMTWPLVAQTGLAGAWSIQMNAYLPDAQVPCVFQGTLDLSTTKSSWTGPMTVSLLSGPAGCPAQMSGICIANLDGNIVTGTLSSDTFGSATFSGSLVPASTAGGSGPTAMRGELTAANQKAQATGPLTTGPAGSLSVTQGGYAGVGGTWSAARLSIIQIPTLARGGVALLVVLILAAATAILLRRRRQMI